MFEAAILLDWLALALRWLHVIAAMAWIGSAFYFIALDLRLSRTDDGRKAGEDWQIHGGGLLHVRQFFAPVDGMPDTLTWFKWESYTTWASGVVLLAVVYWYGARMYLIDPNLLDLAVWQAVVISFGSLIVGWVVYDLLCKSTLKTSPIALNLSLFLLFLVVSWGYAQIFPGRAALLHLGAFAATLMTANVAHVIVPGQRKVLADLKAGRVPDKAHGQAARLRLTHNSHLALPVVFLMLSTHYPLVFATRYNWLIAALVFVIGVLIRHYFHARHRRDQPPKWTIVAVLAVFGVMIWLSVIGREGAQSAMGPEVTRYAQVDGFEQVHDIVVARCSACHAASPVWDGLHMPPKGVVLETPSDVARLARDVYLQAGVTHAMPPANATLLEPRERAAIRAWYRGG